jgi:hypothetical protein
MSLNSGAFQMKVSILGVLVGGIVDVVSSVVLGLPLAVYMALKVPMDLRTDPHASAAISAAMKGNHALYITQLAIGLLCSALGGYIAALIAKRHERLNGTLSCWLCISMGIVGMAIGLDKDPLWQQIPLLVSSPIMAFIGGNLRLRQRMRQPGIAASV